MVESARGILFKNDRKTEGSKLPDWTGNIEVTPEFLQTLLQAAQQAGGMYKAQLAAWVRQGPHGAFLSLSLNPPFVKPDRPQQQDRVVPMQRKPDNEF